MKTTIFYFLILVPLILKAGEVTISWDSNSEPDLSGYKIYYGNSSRGYQSQVYVGNITSYRLSGLDAGKRYYFAVTALDFSGNESDFSQEAEAVIAESPPEDETTEDEQTNVRAFVGQTYNFPNPFKIDLEKTAIRYELTEPAEVTIEILDANMDLVTSLIKNEFRNAGEHIGDVWDGRNSDGRMVSNGVYFCNIRAAREKKIIKIVVTR